jgi:osmotically-inducible protein OsmY
MTRIGYAIGGAAAGAVAVFLLDPERGRSRRTELTQRSGAVLRRVRRTAERQAEYAASQATAVKEKATHLQVEDQAPTPERLKARVESQLFRDPDIPKGDINVNVERDTVVLRGRVADEPTHQRVVSATRRIQGVDQVEDLISVAS